MEPKYDFVALDVETANHQLSSICQIGYCLVENGKIIRSQSYLVNPDCSFTNSHIHGIGPQTVQGSPKFPEILGMIWEDLEGNIILHHGHFDRKAFVAAAGLHGVNLPKSRWLDNAQFLRNVFPRYSQSGYGLKALCGDYGVVQSAHHNAENDAICLAQVFIASLEEAGLTLGEISENPKLRGKADGLDIIQTRGVSPRKNVRDFIPPPGKVEQLVQPDDRPFAGLTVLFTGDFSVPRSELEGLASAAGFTVRKGITKSINYLVVGKQREINSAYIQPSQKIQKAEEFNAEGSAIQLISEEDFYNLVNKEVTAPPVDDSVFSEAQKPKPIMSYPKPSISSVGEVLSENKAGIEPNKPEQQPMQKQNLFQKFRHLHIIFQILIVILVLMLLFVCSAFFAGFIQAI